MKIFKTRTFARWMKKANLSDEALCVAVDEMLLGLIDAQLGGNLVKKRVSQPGRGKRGSTRTIVATNYGDRWFFLFGFEKNERGNILDCELKSLQELASHYLALTVPDIERTVASDKLMEICHGNQKT